MIAAGKGGRIVGASSTLGKQGVPLLPDYVATKAAIRGLTQSAAAELGKHGITVNAYAPGITETDQLQAASSAMEKRTGMSLLDVGAKISNLGRPGRPEEVAGWVSFIVSDDAKYITGQTMCINGGSYYD